MNNKPKIKDIIIYSHPIIGNVTLDDIIQTLKVTTESVKEYEEITINLLKNKIPKDTEYSLYSLMNASTIESILDELEFNIE